MASQGGRGDRLTGHDYFAAALDLLSEGSAESLTITALCARLGVTKGSFYHHFDGLPGFVEGLLVYWQEVHTATLLEMIANQPDIGKRSAMFIEYAIGLPHGAESALRAWGRSHPDVAAAVGNVDKMRERFVFEAGLRLGLERPRARLLTRMAVDQLVGMQMRGGRPDTRRLRAGLNELSRVVFGEAPPPA